MQLLLKIRIIRDIYLLVLCIRTFSSDGIKFYLDLMNYYHRNRIEHLFGKFESRLHAISFHGTPIYYRTYTTDVQLIQEILVGKFFSGGWVRDYDVNLEDTKIECMLDLGANIGLTSIKFASLYPSSTILSIEPEQENFRILEMNVKNYPNIKPINAGVWYRNSNLTIVDPGTGDWGFMVKESDVGIAGRSIDDILFENNVICDFVKMDIEGTEGVIFEHIDDCKWIDDVKVLLIEVHDWLYPGCEKMVRDQMKCRGFLESRHGSTYVFSKRNE